METMTVSDSAHEWITRLIRDSPLTDPVVIFIAISEPVPADPAVFKAVLAGNLELAKAIQRGDGGPKTSPQRVVPHLEPRAKFSGDVLRESRGITLAFPAKTISGLNNWTIDVDADGIVFRDAQGIVRKLFGE